MLVVLLQVCLLVTLEALAQVLAVTRVLAAVELVEKWGVNCSIVAPIWGLLWCSLISRHRRSQELWLPGLASAGAALHDGPLSLAGFSGARRRLVAARAALGLFGSLLVVALVADEF